MKSKSGRIGIVLGGADKANSPMGSSKRVARLPVPSLPEILYVKASRASSSARGLSRFAGLIAACLIATLPGASQADVCMPAAELEAALIDWYGEEPVQQGPSDTVLWSTETGSSWTVVRYFKDGTACSIDSGFGGLADAVSPSPVQVARLAE